MNEDTMTHPNDKPDAGENPIVLCTTDYSLFTFHRQNRGLDPAHILQVMKSMKERGFVPSKAIEVTPNFEIVDGQHRFQAAKNLGLPIYYMIVDKLSIEDVRVMAKTFRPWRMNDYVTSAIRQGNQDYKQILAYKERSGITNWESFLRCGVAYGEISLFRREFAAGRYILTEGRKKAIESFLDKFALFHRVFPGWNHRHFIAACAHLFAHPDYDHERMKKRMEYQSRRLVKCTDTAGYVQLLEEIYNYNSRKENILNTDYKRRTA